MPLRTVILDFDSTLVPCESLERALALGSGVGPSEMARIEAITRRGMSGEIPFRASLEERLAIARPCRDDLLRLGEELVRLVPAAAVALVAALHQRDCQVWIVSGAFRDVLLPTAQRLDVPPSRVLAVGATWDPLGRLTGLADDGFADGKVAGVLDAAPDWPRPAAVVGDGATDRALCEAGLVDHFVAFVGHVRRPGVADRPGTLLAEDFTEVGRVLQDLDA